MSRDQRTSVRCPVCGAPADVVLEWSDDGQSEYAAVRDYRCRNGCRVDAGTVRNIIGAG
jgi:hypothetical protein